MKKLLSLLMLMSLTIVFAQEKVSDADWDKLITQLEAEKWNDVQKITADYLSRFSTAGDTVFSNAALRYIFPRCVGARLGEKEIDKEEALNLTKQLIEKRIITIPKKFAKDCLFNCFGLSEERDSYTSCSSNANRTVIQAFEYFFPEDKQEVLHLDKLYGQTVRMQGEVSEILAEGYAMPRLKINVNHSYILPE